MLHLDRRTPLPPGSRGVLASRSPGSSRSIYLASSTGPSSTGRTTDVSARKKPSSPTPLASRSENVEESGRGRRKPVSFYFRTRSRHLVRKNRHDGVRRPGSLTRREFAFPRGWKVAGGEPRAGIRGGGEAGRRGGRAASGGGAIDGVNVLTRQREFGAKENELKPFRAVCRVGTVSPSAHGRLSPLSLPRIAVTHTPTRDSLADVAASLSLSLPLARSARRWFVALGPSLFRAQLCRCEIHCQWRNQWGIVDPSIVSLAPSPAPPPFSERHRHFQWRCRREQRVGESPLTGTFFPWPSYLRSS